MKFQIDKSDFRDCFELGGGVHREERAKRLLLNESLSTLGDPPSDAPENTRAQLDYLNAVMSEVLVQGLKGSVEESPLPGLYRQFGSDPQLFLDIAWIQLVIDMTAREVADQIESFALELALPYVNVELRAKNDGKPLHINGKCKVAD